MFMSALQNVVLLVISIPCISTQFLGYQPRTSKPSNVCDSSSNTALIEHFFNLIFSEFHSSPPVCVCVQMCADQPTYCYPNGCLKISDKKKNDDSFQNSQETRTQEPMKNMGNTPSFLLDDQSGFLNSFFGDSHAGRTKYGSDSPMLNGVQRPDPFKDKYKNLFKYKKTPKVHLRYNLREQVKNTKSDVIKIEKIDVSKKKWPNKNQFFFEGPQEIPDEYSSPQKNPSQIQNPSIYASKFFKRDIGKVKSKFEEKISQQMNENQNSEEKQNHRFSLENLIENLIESTFGPLQNETELDLNVNLAFDNNATTAEPITEANRHIFNKNSIVIINETNVLSMNMSNENKDQNRYEEASTEMYHNQKRFNEMIANLAKNIEKQNNNSIETMEMILGKRLDTEYLSVNTEIKETTVSTAETTNLSQKQQYNLTTIPFTTTITPESSTKLNMSNLITDKSNTTPVIRILITKPESSTHMNENETISTTTDVPIMKSTDQNDMRNLNLHLKSRQKINRKRHMSKVKLDLNN